MNKQLKRFFTFMFLTAAATGIFMAAPLFTWAAVPSGVPFDAGPRANSYTDPADGVYVSPAGNDSTATGRMDAPYKSINAALAAVGPGGTVVLRGGTYREGINVRIRKPDVTIKSARGEWAVIDLTVHDPGADEDSGVYFDVDSSGGRLRCVEVIGGWYAVCAETKWDWGDPNDRAGASDIIIEDCVLHDSKYDVVKVKPNCDDVVIRYNEIYNSGRAFSGKTPDGEDNAEGIDNVNGDRMIVNNNYIHDICSTAIYAKGGAADVLIEYNFIERAYGAGIMAGFDTSPEYFDLTVNPDYYESIRCVVRNNLIVGAGWEGVGLYGSKDAQIYNNTLIDVANGGRYHSAIYFGLTYQDWESYAGRPANINPSIHHNIVSQPSGIVRPMIEIRYSGELGGMSALEGRPSINDNCYYIADKKASFFDYRPGSVLEDAGLSAWQAHIKSDENSIEEDPAFGNGYLPANPRCAGMGVTAYQLSPPPVFRFTKTKTYRPGQFSDVIEREWYGFDNAKSVATAYEYGLMAGVGGTAFDPAGSVTIAEAVAIAARVRDIRNGGSGEFAQDAVWYQPYIDYAVTNGMINAGDFTDYNKKATRAEVAYVFSRALPEEDFAPLNTVNSLPDVDGGTPYNEAVFTLYKAGVLAGGDDRGTFGHGDYVTRAEAAAIIGRVILPETRISGRVYGK